MPAFTKGIGKIKLSISYDAITLYVHYPAYIDTQVNGVPQIIANPLEKPFDNVLKDVSEHFKEFEEFVLDINPAHELYHNDLLNENDAHSHMKFSCKVTPQILNNMLDVLLKHDLINSAEKDKFLSKYDKRLRLNRKDLLSKLKNKITIDTHVIIHHIKNCEDNDILADLHDYLVKKTQFDYLRLPNKQNNSPTINWQGTDPNNNIVEVTKEWAMIEKSFALQMAHNIQKRISKFTPDVADMQAKKLAKNHSFFTIKRKRQSIEKISNLYQSFSQAKEKKSFQECYDKQFSMPLPLTPQQVETPKTPQTPRTPISVESPLSPPTPATPSDSESEHNSAYTNPTFLKQNIPPTIQPSHDNQGDNLPPTTPLSVVQTPLIRNVSLIGSVQGPQVSSETKPPAMSYPNIYNPFNYQIPLITLEPPATYNSSNNYQIPSITLEPPATYNSFNSYQIPSIKLEPPAFPYATTYNSSNSYQISTKTPATINLSTFSRPRPESAEEDSRKRQKLNPVNESLRQIPSYSDTQYNLIPQPPKNEVSPAVSSLAMPTLPIELMAPPPRGVRNNQQNIQYSQPTNQSSQSYKNLESLSPEVTQRITSTLSSKTWNGYSQKMRLSIINSFSAKIQPQPLISPNTIASHPQPAHTPYVPNSPSQRLQFFNHQQNIGTGNSQYYRGNNNNFRF